MGSLCPALWTEYDVHAVRIDQEFWHAVMCNADLRTMLHLASCTVIKQNMAPEGI